MAIVKLVCQGCGANLDATDDVRVIQCGYCATTNQIKQTVYEQPAAPQRQPPPPQYTPVPQYNPASASGNSSGAGKVIVVIVLVAVFVPLVLGAFIAFSVFRTASKVFDQVGVAFDNAGLNARKYGWKNGRPFVADVNGDGVDDLIGTISESGSQQMLLTAMSGSDWSTLWEVDLGRQSDLPNPTLYYVPGSKLALLGLGATLHAYDAGSGAERWVASLPDKLEGIALDGDHLWVATIDDASQQVALADGKLSPGEPKPPASAKVLRDDSGYELIPELEELDLKYNQFPDLRVQAAFCPDEDLPIVRGRRRDDDAKRCANPRGLAFVTRDKGTQIPYLLGYARDTKAEIWRVQLTKAGSLETVDSGFGQPRAEIIGDDAIVSFVPASANNNARIRRISLIDGSTKWETTLNRKSTENVDGMVVGTNLVFVMYGQSVQALSLESGEALATLGGW